MHCRLFGWVAFLAMLSGATASAAADGVTATNFVPRLGSYEYRIRWQHMTVGKARVSIVRLGDDYVITSRAQTDNAARHLLDASYRGTARIGPDLRSHDVTENRAVRSRVTATRSVYNATGTVDVIKIRSRPRRPVSKKELTLAVARGVVDPFTAILRARAIPWRPGLRSEFELLVGEDRYALTLECTGESSVEIDDQKRPAWRLRPTLRRLAKDGVATDSDDREEQADTIKAVSNARVYLARDDQHDLLRLVSDTSLGAFDVLLTRFRPAPPAAAATNPSAGAGRHQPAN